MARKQTELEEEAVAFMEMLHEGRKPYYKKMQRVSQRDLSPLNQSSLDVLHECAFMMGVIVGLVDAYMVIRQEHEEGGSDL